MPLDLPITDADGSLLTGLHAVDEETVDDAGAPCPLALVVVRRPDATVLVGLNRWRRVWELPGGVREGLRAGVGLDGGHAVVRTRGGVRVPVIPMRERTGGQRGATPQVTEAYAQHLRDGYLTRP
ncbi:hypothetical protein [Cellulomonas sp. S1-8]|uniref:hypothetical protein n=1 Tax=Cellulomonas sp. S1-8 TaxID=2904790 RepID=UPI002244AEBA|nr:hypothetical protein [Cellulomonas sp. S1-8]UZN03690.1 hypothetical protein OKX07_01730 [Cellulomonas sp. S1-8]